MEGGRETPPPPFFLPARSTSTVLVSAVVCRRNSLAIFHLLLPSFFSPLKNAEKLAMPLAARRASLPPSSSPFPPGKFRQRKKETAAFQSYFPFSKVRLWESVVSLRLFFLPPWFCRGGGETYGLAWEWDTTKKKAPPTLPH